MTKKLKYIIFTNLALSVPALVIGLSLGPKPEKNTPPATEEKIAPIKQESPVHGVSVQNYPTEKYILKYKEITNTVYLVTKKTDGTEIMSPVESIKPFYLTEEDLALLTEGIELTEREDMFILIEDFSS